MRDADQVGPGIDKILAELSASVRRLSFEEMNELVGHGNCYVLLAGYAVEDHLKAIRIKRLTLAGKPIEFRKGNSRDYVPTDHKYLAFAEAEIPPISEDESALLKRLSQFARWAGRYPVPLHENDEPLTKAVSARDRDDVHAICWRLVEKYESL